jgi:hypothetical protein
MVVEQVKGGKEVPMPAEIHKNGARNGQFPALFGLKIACVFFRSKVLNKIYSQDVFEEYVNFRVLVT